MTVEASAKENQEGTPQKGRCGEEGEGVSQENLQAGVQRQGAVNTTDTAK